MKKLISAVIASALSLNTLLLFPFETDAESSVYELENGVIFNTGENTSSVVSLSGANGGIGGISSRDGKENIDKWLSFSPAKYVSIAYGTNDCWGNPNNVQSYYENTKYMIDAVLNAGKVSVLPKIPYPEWYPGDDYVDIIGEDIYAGERNYGAQNAKFSELLEYSDSNKIIALTENGTVFDIDKVIAGNSRWAWFGTWCGNFVVKNGKYSEVFTEREMMHKAYNSEYVITLDELDWNN